MFDLFDSNGGGTIDAEELDLTLKSVGIELSQDEILDVLKNIDSDGKRHIIYLILRKKCTFRFLFLTLLIEDLIIFFVLVMNIIVIFNAIFFLAGYYYTVCI